MKKLFLFSIILFQLTFVFGQYGSNKDCASSGCGDRSKNIIRCWGPIRTFSQVPGIQIRVQGPIESCYNAINDEPNKHTFYWHIEVVGKPSIEYKLIATGADGRVSTYGGSPDALVNKIMFMCHTFSNAETLNISVEAIKGSNSSNKSNSTQQNDLSEYNRSKADIDRQMQEKNAAIANKNAETQKQQQILKQQQEAQRQQAKTEAINTAGNIVSNTAMSLTNAGLANLVRQTEIEKELKSILNNRESLYPEASKYFDVYLKEKRKRKTGNLIGIGFLVAGTVATGAGALGGGEDDINYPLVYGGIGGVLVGLFKTVTTLSVGKKGNEALQNAKKSLTLGTASNGMGVSVKF
ncbi:hypothetical protein [Pedobacter cryotolerans]|uniref:Uncharacterized protein n=1 Tax=Pedobacter cryotolerans TaxID=2571270 RepID=A0A4U1CAQ0_9SPHI|nr:hypothetical protein [Pedobacter cryotolerans]TKC03106.1 hypothetical protein FA045_00620 [Pedobacter cryotolerans]